MSEDNLNQQANHSWIAETAKILGLSIVFALGVRSFVAEARWIPTGSMEPTLHGTFDQWEADKVIIDKLTYKFSQLRRGDIIVFSLTKEQQQDQPPHALIKRVIGLPGETVELRDGKVFVNNKELAESNYVSQGQQTAIDVCITGKQPPLLSQPVTIPQDKYLVLGDNRTQSYDGRCWGLVPRENIIGRAVVRFWPLNKIGAIDKTPLYP